ncbi:MAG TPA: endonuclease domain-containing protein [Burkholderiales bacterium]|nr:endonuclease domain-containing protein [Burkholderiales bacterium]
MQKDREYRQRRRGRTRGAAHEEDVNQRRTESLAHRLSQWWRLRQGDGLSRNAYAAMLAGQGGVCATCRRPHADPLVVDRSRVTGEVRGLLCRRCKAALPWFRDDHALLLRAIAYLKNGGPLVDKP